MDFRFGEQTGGLPEDAYSEDVAEDTPSGGDFSAKRIFDIVAATLGLVFLAPLLLVFALLIRLQDGQSVLYCPARLGYRGQTFRCFKLRTMVPDADSRLQAVLESCAEASREWDLTQKLTNDPRITPLGKFIRSTSIDELPQLINIIRGDMSLVGPRPISFNERLRYGEYFDVYTRVRPGLTGLWQTSGRSNTTYAERIQLDTKYVQTRTFWGDVLIIVKTVPAVLLSVGAK
jgi:lipopolysaccharide/colanic/teichoic acid biosynthesis glycosyltransferase